MATAKPPQLETTSKPVAVHHGERRKVVVEHLLSEIFQGSLKAGTRLIIQELAARFGMSPTPIREGLIQLQGLGIIDFVPNCGGVVRQVTSSDVKEVCQVRKALECEATRSACGRIELPLLHNLADAFRKTATAKRYGPSFVEKARQLDSQLHDLIAQSCGNRFLKSELERMKLVFRAFRDAAWEQRLAANDHYRLVEEAEEHLTITEALIEGNTKQAGVAMARHIRSGVKYWSRGLPDR